MGKIELLTRTQWGAYDLPRLGWVVPLEQFVGLVGHHTVMVLGDTDADGYANGDLDDIGAYMRRLQDGARPDLGRDVPYSWVIFEGIDDNHAIICEGRGLFRTGAHTAGYNSTRWGCAFAGDYTYRSPSPGQYAAFNLIGAMLADPVNAQPTLRHGDTVATACPGASTDLSQCQPPFIAAPPKEEDMVRYILRYGPNLDDEPWLAIYESGRVRYLGAIETAFLRGPDPNAPLIPFIDEVDYKAYSQAKKDAGII